MKSLYLIFILVFGSDKVGSYPQESRQLANQDENESNFTPRQNEPPPYAQLQQPWTISEPWYNFPAMDQRIPLKWSSPLQNKPAAFEEPRKDGLSYLADQGPEDMPINNEGLPSRFFANYYENPFYGGRRFYKPESMPDYTTHFPEASVNQPNTSNDRPHQNQQSESSNFDQDQLNTSNDRPHRNQHSESSNLDPYQPNTSNDRPHRNQQSESSNLDPYQPNTSNDRPHQNQQSESSNLDPYQPNTSNDRPHRNQQSESSHLEPDQPNTSNDRPHRNQHSERSNLDPDQPNTSNDRPHQNQQSESSNLDPYQPNTSNDRPHRNQQSESSHLEPDQPNTSNDRPHRNQHSERSNLDPDQPNTSNDRPHQNQQSESSNLDPYQPNTSNDRPHRNQQSEGSNLEPDVTLAPTKKASAIQSHPVVVAISYKVPVKTYINNVVVPDYKNGSNEHTYLGEGFESYESPDMKPYSKTPKRAKTIEYKVITRPPNTKMYVVPLVPSKSLIPLSGPNLKQEISNNVTIKPHYKLTDNVQHPTHASDNDSEYIDDESEGLEINVSTKSTWVTTTDTVPTPIVEASGLNVLENSFEHIMKAFLDDTKALAEPNAGALFNPSDNFSTKKFFNEIKEKRNQKRNVRLEPSFLNNLKDNNYHIYEKNPEEKFSKMDIPEEVYGELTEAGITEYMSSPNIIKPTGNATEYATVPMKEVNTDYSSKAPQIVKTTPIKEIETNKPYTANAKSQVNSQTNNQPNSQVSSHARIETNFKSVDKAPIVPPEVSNTNGAPITITSRINRPVKKTYRRTEKNPVRPVVYSFRNKNGRTVVIPINVTENPIKPFVEYPLLPIPLINVPIPKEHPNKDNVKKEKVEPGSIIYSESAKTYEFDSKTDELLGDNEATSKAPTKIYSSRLVRKMSNEDKNSFVPIIDISSYKASTQSNSATTPVYSGESKSTIASKIETTASPQTNVVTDQYYNSASFSTYKEAKENGIKTKAPIDVNNPPENIIEPKPSSNVVYDAKSMDYPDSITLVEYNTSKPDIKKPQTNYYEVTSTEIPKVTPVEHKVNIHIINIHPNDMNVKPKETLNNTATTRQKTDKSEIVAPESNYEDTPTPSPTTKPYAYHTDNKPTETNIYKTSTGQKVGNPVVIAQPYYHDEPALKSKSNYIDNKTIDFHINRVSIGQNIDMHDAPKPYQYHDDKPTYTVNTTRVESEAVAHVTGHKNPYQDEGKTTDKPIDSNLEYRFDKYIKHTSKTYGKDNRDYESITLPPYDEVKTTKTSIYTKSIDHNTDKPDILTTKPNTFDVTTSAPFEHKTDQNYDKFENVIPHKEYQYDNVQTTNKSTKNIPSENKINEPEVMKTQPYKTTKSPITEADDTKIYPRTSQLFKLFSFLLSGITKSSSDEAVTTETNYYSSTKAPVIESKSISKAEAKAGAGKPEENSPIANKNDKITTVDSTSNTVVSSTIVTTENLDEKVAVDAMKKVDKPETLPPIVRVMVKTIESHTSDEETEYIKSTHELVEKLTTPMQYTVLTAVDSTKSNEAQRKETKDNQHNNPSEFNNKSASAISKASTIAYVKKLDKRNIVPATDIPGATSKPAANDSIKDNIDISKMKGETETFSINSSPQKPIKGLSDSNHYRNRGSSNVRKEGNHHVDRAVKRDSKTRVYKNGTIVEEFTEVKENDKGKPMEIRKTLIFRYPGEYK